jgi:hypothetical protein
MPELTFSRLLETWNTLPDLDAAGRALWALSVEGDDLPSAGPDRGPLLSGTVPGAIGVLEGRDRHRPIGMALGIGRDAAGRAVWRLVVHDQIVPGRWVVVDRQFHPAQW